MAADVPGRLRPDQLENVRLVTSRGKQESALLVILMGTAAPLVGGSYVPRTPQVDRLEFTTQISSYKGSVLLTVLTTYPADVVGSFDDFNGYGFPEPPFIQMWKPVFNVIDSSYVPFDTTTDVTQFRRVPFFAEVVPFSKQQPRLLLTNLVKVPLPTSDTTFRARMSTGVYPLPFLDKTWKAAWFVPLMPGLLVPRPPVALFTGAGNTQGYFSGYRTIGYFN